MKKRIAKIIVGFVGLFLLLFVFRIAYGYTLNVADQTTGQNFFSSLENVRRNYASKKFQVNKSAPSGGGAAVSVDQKYEKIATIKSKTDAYESEEQKLRTQIKAFNGVIQFEKSKGNKGHRSLHLLIGIQPDEFERFYEEMLQIGKTLFKEISKKDKTNEYKELNAKKASLQKIRSSLLELKSKSGNIEEYIKLENRILEIEEQLQGLGVQLGNYDEENEFCTVRISLLEGKVVKISLLHRIKVALEWTVPIYLALVFSLLIVSIMAYILVRLIDRFNLLRKLMK